MLKPTIHRQSLYVKLIVLRPLKINVTPTPLKCIVY